MLGILAGIIQVVGTTVFNANMNEITLNNRNEALKNGNEFYYNSRGKMLKIDMAGKDDECYYKIDPATGHKVIACKRNNEIIRDFNADEEWDKNVEFKKKYNEAKEMAIKEGKKYFFVCGINAIDKRYGYYELATEKRYTQEVECGEYIRTYWKTEMNSCRVEKSIFITEDEYKELGGKTYF